MVFTAVGLSAFALALAGLVGVRVYDDQLVRQTESELIAQGVVISEAFHNLLRDQAGAAEYGAPRTAPWPFPLPAGGELRPILPALSASAELHPPPSDPPASGSPADARARRAGERLNPVLVRTSRATLAGIRVVDARGVVVASSGSGEGTSLLGREEVARALRGEPNSRLRRRLSEHGDAPLESLSRNTGIRVSVALPILEGDRVWGAVLLSRTPMTLARAVYADRWNLSATGVVLLGVVALVSLAAAALVLRPVRSLIRQARAITANEPSGFEPIGRPVVQELAELSEALAAMAATLRERSEYIRSFAANVSHEFKTPLSSIQGAVELLRGSAGAMSAEQRDRFLANVEQDAKRLTELVRRLLELARADSMVPAAEEAELAPVLSALAGRAAASGRRIGVAPCEGRIALPAEVLESVLWQLCCNAWQHGGDEIAVHVSVERAPPAVRVVVRDEGPGVSEANRARIFDPFFTTARDRGGTGLGLPIAVAMLRPFGARLELLPSEGKGAAFAVAAQRK
ncbi:MAG: HAMP domain-containing histidine kinase [Myxococcales bacterium]|nr:HAMP domain-containing histidine kinase [Myxococcales bacterium]